MRVDIGGCERFTVKLSLQILDHSHDEASTHYPATLCYVMRNVLICFAIMIVCQYTAAWPFNELLSPPGHSVGVVVLHGVDGLDLVVCYCTRE